MGRIRQLDTQTANMIAAGEVVERPMGVVKELVENAIDAGATRVTVSIEEGGISRLTVEDNGIGMDSEDAQMAFRRHATSKIRTENDLWAISTLGFRGEALPSIAAVAKVTLVTSDGNEATKVTIEYGNTVSVMPYPCNQGTRITVEGLFYQTPARLKHMRSASYEASLIQEVITKFALSHPEISFRLYNENRQAFQTSGQGDLAEVIFQVYGRGAFENMIPVSFDDYDYQVSGYLVRPEISRASRNAMHVFLNGRMVRTFKIFKAIQDGYEGYLPKGRYPVCVLNVEMDPHILDVNVHPSKWEVRISKEMQLEYLITENIRRTLQANVLAPKAPVQEARIQYYEPISFDTEDLQAKPQVQEEPVKEEPKEIREEPKQEELSLQEEIEKDNELLRQLMPAQPEVREEEKAYEDDRVFPEMRVIGQLHQKYILAETEQGLAVIAQRSAMERVNYERILGLLEKTPVMSECLVPLVIQVSDDLVRRLDEINEAMKDIHIEFEQFGHDTLALRQIPLWMQDLEEERFLSDLIDLFREETGVKKMTVEKMKIAELAGRRSVHRKQTLSYEEMQQVVSQLSACRNPYYSPSGKPVFIVLDEKELTKELRK